MKVEIGKRLKMLRLERGLTQKELAARVSGGLDYTYIGKIERGEQLPSLKILIKIGEALSVPVGYFFSDNEGTAVPCIELKLFAGRGRELVNAIESLHKDDIPLVIEIVRALNRHRSGAAKFSKSVRKDLPLAAEDGAAYRKK